MSADDPDKEHKLEGALPCPFCGGDDIWTYAGSTFRWRYAACSECGAQSGEVRIDTIGKARHAAVAEADKECLVEWNHRPPTEANDARSAFNAAIDFAIELGDYEGMGFLKLWREGDWEVIAGEFPDFDLSTTGFR